MPTTRNAGITWTTHSYLCRHWWTWWLPHWWRVWEQVFWHHSGEPVLFRHLVLDHRVCDLSVLILFHTRASPSYFSRVEIRMGCECKIVAMSWSPNRDPKLNSQPTEYHLTQVAHRGTVDWFPPWLREPSSLHHTYWFPSHKWCYWPWFVKQFVLPLGVLAHITFLAWSLHKWFMHACHWHACSLVGKEMLSIVILQYEKLLNGPFPNTRTSGWLWR